MAARLHAARLEYAPALEQFDHAIAIDSTLPEAWYNRGIVKSELKDYHGAISDFTRVTILHHFAECSGLPGIQDTQGIREHHPADTFIPQTGDHEMDIIPGMAHTVRPVFQVYINPDAHFPCLTDHIFYVRKVLLRSFPELLSVVTSTV